MKTEMDSLTGLYYNREFLEKADEKLEQLEKGTHMLVAIDIQNFRLFNKLYGREEGDRLLAYVAGCIRELQDSCGGFAGYLGGDNFAILMPQNPELLTRLQEELDEGISNFGSGVGFLPAFGVYAIENINLPVVTMYDKATIAMSHVNSFYGERICYYDTSMVEEMESEILLLAEIHKALERDEFIFYAQPQCDILTGKIVGAESLVRWKHREKGLIPPGVFIPVLEKNGLIGELDKYVWRKVCQWMRDWLDQGNMLVPVSINVSRLDIFSLDVPEYLIGLVNEYNLKPEHLKVEITESAYAENDDRIKSTVKQLRDAGFLVMMDDFGSGYSSLNMLKSVSVDVLKIDMKFLEISENESGKGIGILESVVNMSRQLGLPIIVEGVETKKQEDFLIEMGCRYTQGYYYYKPLPVEEFEKLLTNEAQLDLNGFWCRQVEPLHVRELFDSNLFSDTLLNNILGPLAFYDIYQDKVEITRVNNQYYLLTGVSTEEEAEYSKKLWNHIQDDDQQFLLNIFEKAYESPLNGGEGYVRYLRADGGTLWVYLRAFFLREKDGHKSFMGSLTDVTKVYEENHRGGIEEQVVKDLPEKQQKSLEEFYGDLPCGFGVGKIVLDAMGKPCDYEVLYGNHEIERISGGNLKRLKEMVYKLFEGKMGEIMEKCYRAAFMGEMVNYYVYSRISNRYLEFTFYQYEYGYVGCLSRDVTHSHIHEDAMRSTMQSYREVYFIHLEDNYYRMIHPHQNLLKERGNYEEGINRHFGSGKILPYDEENIRKFLSLKELKEALKTEDSVEYKYLRRINDTEEWCLTSIMVAERENGVPKTAVMTIRSIDTLIKEEEIRQKRHITELLAAMSDGFFIYLASEGERILYANTPVIRMFGCENIEEFRELTGNSFRGMVHPEDVERVEKEIEEQIRNSSQNMDYTEYRIIRKDGSVRWINDWGHLENGDKNNPLFYVVIKDVTEERKELR